MEYKEKDSGDKKSMGGDVFLGLLIFVALIFVLFEIAQGLKGVSFIFGGLLIGCLGTFFVSMITRRPGLILGFLGSIVLIVLALFILLASICGVGRH